MKTKKSYWLLPWTWKCFRNDDLGIAIKEKFYKNVRNLNTCSYDFSAYAHYHGGFHEYDKEILCFFLRNSAMDTLLSFAKDEMFANYPDGYGGFLHDLLEYDSEKTSNFMFVAKAMSCLSKEENKTFLASEKGQNLCKDLVKSYESNFTDSSYSARYKHDLNQNCSKELFENLVPFCSQDKLLYFMSTYSWPYFMEYLSKYSEGEIELMLKDHVFASKQAVLLCEDRPESFARYVKKCGQFSPKEEQILIAKQALPDEYLLNNWVHEENISYLVFAISWKKACDIFEKSQKFDSDELINLHAFLSKLTKHEKICETSDTFWSSVRKALEKKQGTLYKNSIISTVKKSPAALYSLLQTGYSAKNFV